jgi:hypothetical protein
LSLRKSNTKSETPTQTTDESSQESDDLQNGSSYDSSKGSYIDQSDQKLSEGLRNTKTRRYNPCNTTDESQNAVDLKYESSSNESTEESSDEKDDWMSLVMSNRAKLEGLRKSNMQKRSSILNRADRELIQCLSQCVEKTLRGKLELSDAQYQRLAKHKLTLRKLSNPYLKWSEKKAIIIHNDGFILPLLTAVFSNIMKTNF